MPYITQEERDVLLKNITDATYCQTPGQLNFMFTELINSYIYEKKLSYQTINDVLGALEGAKLEFYRRVVVPYENAKLTMNGDVYE